MKRIFTILTFSFVLLACNKEEETEQLIGWDKIVAEVGQTDKSAVEVLHSLTENELWVAHNVWGYSEDKDGNIIELKVIENGKTELFPGPDYKYRMQNNDTMLHYYHSTETKLGAVYYTRPYEVQIDGNNIRLTAYHYSVDKIWYSKCWEILAYDENQIIIKSTNVYQEPMYDYKGNIITSDETYLYSLIQLVRYDNFADGKWKDAITEEEFYELKNK